MTGGNRQNGYEDGYDKSPEELAKAEQTHDDLEALDRGLQALKLAVEWLREGGYTVPRVQEEITAIKLAIGLLKGNEP